MTQFEKMFHVMKKPWVIGLYIIFIIVSYHWVDRPLAIYFHQLDIRTHVHALNILSILGRWEIYVLLFLITGLYFHYLGQNTIWEKRSWFLLGCVALASLLVLILKISLSRSRPELLFSKGLFGFYWFKLEHLYWSFPSGHTITVVSLASGLGILFSRYLYAFLGLALLVSLSRVLLYFHYLSDVMAGFYLGILVVGVFVAYLQKNYHYPAKSSSSY